ncbi:MULTISPECIES: hypothetical protein [Pseudomonas syringae group]|uniref:hypothetical protein n=1 Tax=Pseudomonas syringae group TaxID=136849 RepID=UPI0002EA9166|nr:MULTISPECIES: hypothetical protein [Pseudomonas syringae group]KPX34321.1 hypothetical protein ALO77_01942 [Pseudomonas coronafaciens pv. garcae]RMV84499.1 hypothetical protein ALP02_02596 [Pseudomonas coronafaciens pv. garcae]
MSAEISFDNELAVATISLANWAAPLVEHLGRYFDVREDILRLDYAHLSADCSSAKFDWLWQSLTDRESFSIKFADAARQGTIALTLAILGHESIGIMGSSSILDESAYLSAAGFFRNSLLLDSSRALREVLMAEIAPGERWVAWLLDENASDRSRFLNDREIMAALVASTSKDDCIRSLQLVAPRDGQNNWAFEQLVEEHWLQVCDYLETHLSTHSVSSSGKMPDLVFLLFAKSPRIQASRRACEQVLERVDATIFPRLIRHCRTLLAEDVRSLFLRWYVHPKAGNKDDLKECVAKACSTLAGLLAESMPSDLALAAAWHEFVDPLLPTHQNVAASLKELPSVTRYRDTMWSQLGPSAREAWREDLFEQLREEAELAQGLLDFACRWLTLPAFAEAEPVLLRLMDDEDHLAFVTRLANVDPRQVRLRARGLVRSKQGAQDLDGAEDRDEGALALPAVGAQTWLGDPSIERVIHRALSRIEEKFCHEYPRSWGEDEEVHTARLLTLTQEAISNASQQLRQLSATNRATYPSLSVKFRQPSKREEGATTVAGAPLGADVLFLTRIVDEDETVIQRVTLVQVKKRYGARSGNGFSSTVGIDLRQCEDMLTQSEHAYYLFATPVSSRPTIWIAPARLIRNLTQLNTSKASVAAMQVRDASCSYADFFLNYLIGLWAGDEHDDIVAIANGDSRLGRTPRHIVELEIRRQSE